MGLRRAKTLQAIFVVMFAWFVYSRLGGWHWLLALVVLLLAFLNVVTVWMLRENRDALARCCRNALITKYVRGVCYVMGQQMPMDDRPGAVVDQLLLRTQRDFQVAAGRAKQIVRGHDEVLERALARLFENIALRKARRHSQTLGPIASFLLLGKDGIGKRYLARVLSKLLYRSGRVEVFECDRITAESLIGVKGHPGDLLDLVRKEPFQLLVFERVDRASADVSNVLSRLLSTGQLTQPGAESSVSFKNTTVVLTAESCEAIECLDGAALSPSAWQQKVIEYLCDARQLDTGLLSGLHEILLCASPSDEVKAEVVSLLLQKECRAHGIELSHVDPVILATQVLQIDDATGFAHAPNRVKKLLSRPLVAAASDQHDSLSLRVGNDSPRSSLIRTNR